MRSQNQKKHREPLTGAQQQLATEAWEHARYVLSSAVRKYGNIADFHGEIAERICSQVQNFDPLKSSLKTWAIHHAQFAVSDALLRRASWHHRYTKTAAPRVVSIYSQEPGSHEARFETEAPQTRMVLDDQDAIEDFTKGLSPMERTSLVDSVVHDRELKEIAQDFGISPVRISQARRSAIEKLREKLSPNKPGG